MIDVRENSVLAPLRLKQREPAEAKGLPQGQPQRPKGMLIEQSTGKFGRLPAWAVETVHSPSAAPNIVNSTATRRSLPKRQMARLPSR